LSEKNGNYIAIGGISN